MSILQIQSNQTYPKRANYNPTVLCSGMLLVVGMDEVLNVMQCWCYHVVQDIKMCIAIRLVNCVHMETISQHNHPHALCSACASGLVVKSNVAIVGPRVRFPAGAYYGGLAQLVERMLSMHEVVGSIPTSSSSYVETYLLCMSPLKRRSVCVFCMPDAD